MAKYEYLEQCADIVASIDSEELAERVPGREIGTGSRFTVSKLGKIATANGDLHVAAKWGHRDDSGPFTRLYSEITLISFLVKEAPELADKVPQLLGGIVIDDHFDPYAIITEDATRSGEFPISGRPTSRSTRDSLVEALSQFGSIKDIIDDEELVHTLAYRVGDEERLLDFTPPPFYLDWEVTDEASTAVLEFLEEGHLSVSISEGTPLSQAFPRFE